MLSSKRQPLPPNVEEARKTRINNELVDILKRPCPPNTKASVQGIGLYTHIEGHPVANPIFPHMKYLQGASKPLFLPIGGPKESSNGNPFGCPMDDEVRRAWGDVREAVNEEKERVASADMDIDQLKDRYGALELPEESSGVEIGLPPNGRQLSVDTGFAREVVMGGTEEQSRSATTASRNEYEASRDPRLRGRQ